MDSKCVFCSISAGQVEKSTVYEDEQFIVIMDAYPLTPFHVLIIPKRHVQYLQELTTSEKRRLFELGDKVTSALKLACKEQIDFNMLLNDGKLANQTIPHVHLHVIPRRKHDFIRSLPKLTLHITGLFGLRTSRRKLDDQAKKIAEVFRP